MPLLRGALAVILAVILADYGLYAWVWISASALVLYDLWRRRLSWYLAAFLAVLVGGRHAEITMQQDAWVAAYKQAAPGALEVSVKGVVVGEPRVGMRSTRFRCKVTEVNGSLPTGVLLDMSWQGKEMEHGDRIAFSAELERPKKATNPGQFNRDRFLWRERVPLQVKRVISLRREGRVKWSGLMKTVYGWRQEIERRVTLGVEEGSVAERVIKAVTLGERPSPEDTVLRDFRDSGTLHVFSVSGLHVGLVLVILGYVFRICGIPLMKSAWFLMVVAVAYAAITSFSPAAVRAALMACFFLLGTLLRQRSVFFNSMALSLLLVLAVDSHQLFKPGFQLSYGVLSIIVLTSGFVRRFMSPLVELDEFLPATLYSPAQERWLAVRRWWAGVGATSLVAWIGSIPLAGWYFRMFTPVSILASVILAPLVMILLGLAMLGLVLGTVSSRVNVGINKVNGFCANACAYVAGVTADVPGGSWDVQHLLAEEGRVVVFDLAAGGNAIAVNEGEGLLIDAGDRRDYRSVVMEGLRAIGVRPQTCIVTHPGADACGGMTAQLSQGDVKTLWLPAMKARSLYYRQMVEEAEEVGSELERPELGTWYSLSEESRWRVLNAPWELDGSVLADEWTLVIQLEIRGWKLLLMGDAGYATERELLRREWDLKSDVIIYGNNSLDPGGAPDFLKQVKPDVALLSHSDFPEEAQVNPNLFSELKRLNVGIFLNSEHGAVSLKCDRDTLTVTGFTTKEKVSIVR